MVDNIYMLADAEICRLIGQKVRRLRLRQNFTQTVLAQQAQISVSTLKRIEEGEIRSFDAILRVLRILGELEIFAPLLKEEEMSPNEYYEFMETAGKKRRKRAASDKTVKQAEAEEEESEW